MSNFLDQAGLEYFWAKIVAKIEGASVTLPKKLVKYSAVQSISATEILNATTLGGYSASHFAKASDVSDLSGSVTKQGQALATLGPKVTTLETAVNGYETRVGDLESNNKIQDTTITQHGAAITKLGTKVDDHTLSITTLNNAIEGIPQAISGKLDKSGGTMTGPLIAKVGSDQTVAQVRNIIVSTEEPTSEDGSDGDIWIRYTE